MRKDGSGKKPSSAHLEAFKAVQGGMSQREAERTFRICRKVLRKMIQRTETHAENIFASEKIADMRADKLSEDMSRLFKGSRYPVINPEAMHVDSSLTYRTDRITGRSIATESTPRTWLSDTLRVAGVANPRNQVYIFTGAQNDTPIHRPFWNNLQAYATHLNAKIVVGPWTYETNWWSENNPASRHYDPLIADYLCFGQMSIGENFMFAGEMNTLPTATRPIGDLTTYSQGRWAVFPHPRLQLLSVPSINPADQAFQIMTTGAVTIPQVIPRKAGVKSLSFHTIGATIVEFDKEGDLFCRSLLATDIGSFQDLDAIVANGRVTRGHSVLSMSAADIHVAKMGTKNALGTFGFDYKSKTTRPDSIIGSLKPDWVFLHDIHDHESRSHHEKDNVAHAYEMAVRNRESVEDEIRRGVLFLEKLSRSVSNIGVVESNHDQALERYVLEGRYRGDGINHLFGLKMDVAYHEWREKMGLALEKEAKCERFSVLEWAVRNISETGLKNVKWIYDGASFVLDGIQNGFHGHRGVNGAKGSVTGFARTGHKITMGHSHSPQILDRVFCVGTMELQHGYNKGMSGWAVTHAVQYPNGHRSLITMQNGKWRGNFS